MASTIQLTRTVNNAIQFIRNAPLDNNAAGDPAFTIGDWVRMFMLAPPFAWRWNRSTTTFTTTAGTQDYTESLSTFGYLEMASITDNTGATPIVHELAIANNLAEESTQNQPTTIAARLDNDTGSITFRITPTPDKVYTVTVTYQNAAALFTNLTNTWTPIPDFMSHIYNQGYLAKTYEYMNDPRAGLAMQIFFKQLAAASAGLDDRQRNIFIQQFLDTTRDQQAQLGKSQLATQARSSL